MAGSMKTELEQLLEEIEASKKRLRDLELLSEQRACGILDVSRGVLLKTIPRVVISPGVFRWRVVDIEAFLKERLEPALY